ncbi:MAG: cytochrome-c peroxidase, partial [Cryomorphaceae bacterium]
VIDHYSHGVVDHPNLDARLKDVQGNAAIQNITEAEKASLIVFLNTLTDHNFTTNPAFSDPFN